MVNLINEIYTIMLLTEVINMPYEIKAECPRCGKKAKGLNEIEEKFGFRVMENGQKIPQSHCKQCRAEEQKINK